MPSRPALRASASGPGRGWLGCRPAAVPSDPGGELLPGRRLAPFRPLDRDRPRPGRRPAVGRGTGSGGRPAHRGRPGPARRPAVGRRSGRGGDPPRPGRSPGRPGAVPGRRRDRPAACRRRSTATGTPISRPGRWERGLLCREAAFGLGGPGRGPPRGLPARIRVVAVGSGTQSPTAGQRRAATGSRRWLGPPSGGRRPEVVRGLCRARVSLPALGQRVLVEGVRDAERLRAAAGPGVGEVRPCLPRVRVHLVTSGSRFLVGRHGGRPGHGGRRSTAGRRQAGQCDWSWREAGTGWGIPAAILWANSFPAST